MICLAEDLNLVSSFNFSENIFNNYNVVCKSFAKHFACWVKNSADDSEIFFLLVLENRI